MRYLICLICIAFSLFAQSEQICNPALLLQGQQPEVTLSSEITTEGRAKSLSGMVSMPLGLFQSVGLSATDQFKRSGLDGTVLTGHYAINPFATFDFGASVSYLTYRDRYRHHNGTMSLGMNYRFSLHPIAGEHHLGLSGRNLFAVPHEAVPDLIDPTSIMLGWNGKVWDQRLQFSADIGADILDKSLLYRTKFEFRPSIFTMGVEKSTDAWSVSTGVSLLNTDVAVSYNEYESEMRVGIVLSRRLGANRDLDYAYLLRPHPSLKPGDYYTRSIKASSQLKHMRTIRLVGQLIHIYPNFFMNDFARVILTENMLQLDFCDASQHTVNSIWISFSSDSLIPKIRALELEVAVKRNNSEVPSLFKLFLTSEPSDSLRNVVEYQMGCYYFNNGQYKKAITHLGLVDESCELFSVSQRDLKVAQYLSEKSLRFILPDRALVDRYKSLMKEHEVLGLKVVELISTHESSYTIMKLSEIEKQINQNLVLIEQYKQAVEDEKNRLLKLAEESQ